MSHNDFDTPNLLLNALDQSAVDLLRPMLTRVSVSREQKFACPGEVSDRAYFMEGGIVSCVAAEASARTEVGLIGREGMVGIGPILGDDVASFEIFVQVDGTTAQEIGIDALRGAMEKQPRLRTLLLQYAHTFMLQVSFGLVASAQQMMEARLARWLLMSHDRVDGDEIALTHEFMAMMITAQRSGVTMTLHSLEGAGMIRSTRGLVTILDRTKLTGLAGDSYGVSEARYSEMIAPFGK